MVNGNKPRKRRLGVASVRGAQRAVVGGAIRRNQTFRRKSNDPTTRLARNQKAIRKGTMNISTVLDPTRTGQELI